MIYTCNTIILDPQDSLTCWSYAVPAYSCLQPPVSWLLSAWPGISHRVPSRLLRDQTCFGGELSTGIRLVYDDGLPHLHFHQDHPEWPGHLHHLDYSGQHDQPSIRKLSEQPCHCPCLCWPGGPVRCFLASPVTASDWSLSMVWYGELSGGQICQVSGKGY